MKSNLTEKEFEIVAHALGIRLDLAKRSHKKKDKYLPEEFYRNYFCAGAGHSDIPTLESLVGKGFMHKWNQFDNQYYGVTELGISEFRDTFFLEITKNFKPLTRSKKRYRDYLDTDNGLTFAEFLGIN